MENKANRQASATLSKHISFPSFWPYTSVRDCPEKKWTVTSWSNTIKEVVSGLEDAPLTAVSLPKKTGRLGNSVSDWGWLHRRLVIEIAQTYRIIHLFRTWKRVRHDSCILCGLKYKNLEALSGGKLWVFPLLPYSRYIKSIPVEEEEVDYITDVVVLNSIYCHWTDTIGTQDLYETQAALGAWRYILKDLVSSKVSRSGKPA